MARLRVDRALAAAGDGATYEEVSETSRYRDASEARTDMLAELERVVPEDRRVARDHEVRFLQDLERRLRQLAGAPSTPPARITSARIASAAVREHRLRVAAADTKRPKPHHSDSEQPVMDLAYCTELLQAFRESQWPGQPHRELLEWDDLGIPFKMGEGPGTPEWERNHIRPTSKLAVEEPDRLQEYLAVREIDGARRRLQRDLDRSDNVTATVRALLANSRERCAAIGLVTSTSRSRR